MRILLLAQFLPPVSGGEERHVWNLARALASRSHDVTLLGFATDAEAAGETVQEGVRIVRVRTAASRLPVLYSDPQRPHALPLPDPVVSGAIRQESADRPVRRGARPQLDRQQCTRPGRRRRGSAGHDAA